PRGAYHIDAYPRIALAEGGSDPLCRLGTVIGDVPGHLSFLASLVIERIQRRCLGTCQRRVSKRARHGPKKQPAIHCHDFSPLWSGRHRDMAKACCCMRLSKSVATE